MPARTTNISRVNLRWIPSLHGACRRDRNRKPCRSKGQRLGASFEWVLVILFCLVAGFHLGQPGSGSTVFPSRQVLAQEPPAVNPFAPRPTVREDAMPGYVELSDGTILVGQIYMTRDKRLKVYDENVQRQREIPLSVVAQIDCKILKEWMEKEWRFQETTRDEKYYTGRQYPAREYEHTITLKDGRQITGGLAEILYVETEQDRNASGSRSEPIRLILHKRQKGEIGQTLKDLVYVKTVKLGEEALAEGKRKASMQRRAPSPKDSVSARNR
jgi:hypothetical protein